MSDRLASCMLALALGACRSAEPAPPAVPAPEEPAIARPRPPPKLAPSGFGEPAGHSAIRPNHRVPAFVLTSAAGTTIDSRDIVGKQPFALVFFATWCGVCERKMPIVQKAFAELGDDMLLLGVAVDDADSWAQVPAYISSHGLDLTIIRAEQHMAFFRAYDPFNRIPLVIVVDRDGMIAELQTGLHAGDSERLAAALRLVRAIDR